MKNSQSQQDGLLVEAKRSYSHREYCLHYDGKAKQMGIYGILTIVNDAIAEAEEKIDLRLKVMPYRKFHIVFNSIVDRWAVLFKN